MSSRFLCFLTAGFEKSSVHPAMRYYRHCILPFISMVSCIRFVCVFEWTCIWWVWFEVTVVRDWQLTVVDSIRFESFVRTFIHRWLMSPYALSYGVPNSIDVVWSRLTQHLLSSSSIVTELTLLDSNSLLAAASETRIQSRSVGDISTTITTIFID